MSYKIKKKLYEKNVLILFICLPPLTAGHFGERKKKGNKKKCIPSE